MTSENSLFLVGSCHGSRTLSPEPCDTSAVNHVQLPAQKDKTEFRSGHYHHHWILRKRGDGGHHQPSDVLRKYSIAYHHCNHPISNQSRLRILFLVPCSSAQVSLYRCFMVGIVLLRWFRRELCGAGTRPRIRTVQRSLEAYRTHENPI